MTNFFYKYGLLGLILFGVPQVGHSQSELDSLIRQLKLPNASIMRSAHDKLIAKGKAAITPLIALLRNEKRIVFEDSGWLGYSGKRSSVGGWCGIYIDYELDITAERAAWTLEDLTFQNWGYQDVYIGKISRGSRAKKIEATWRRDSLFLSPQAIKQRKAKRQILADSVAAWWKRNEHDWTRQKAIKEALYSQDTIRQAQASYLIYCNKYVYKERNSTDFLRLARQFAVANSPTSQYYPKLGFHNHRPKVLVFIGLSAAYTIGLLVISFLLFIYGGFTLLYRPSKQPKWRLWACMLLALSIAGYVVYEHYFRFDPYYDKPYRARYKEEIYVDLFKDLDTVCTKIIDFEDESEVWLHAKICPNEMSRLMALNHYALDSASTKDWLPQGPYTFKLWFNPKLLGDSVLVYTLLDSSTKRFIYTNYSQTEMYCLDYW